jgi:ketosteroid isomerase-like protein
MSAEEIAHRFYRAFQQRDAAAMRACYAPDVHFSDPAFPDLRGAAAGDMWTMLTSRATDFELTYEVLSATADRAEVAWEAHYTFSRTGRKVVNKIRAELRIKDGLIQEHKDSFDFHRWARQALGLPGLLLGWTSFLRRKVQATAAAELAKFQAKNR